MSYLLWIFYYIIVNRTTKLFFYRNTQLIKNMTSILLIAYKFNDIFYSLNTAEFKNADHKSLIIFETENVKKNDFPCLYLFDNVYSFRYSLSTFSYLKILIIVTKSIKKIGMYANIVMFSNPVLAMNQFISKLLKVSHIILIEDGTMNYYHFTPRESISKKIIQNFLCINEKQFYEKIKKTYLLKSDIGKYYFGDKVDLKLSFHGLDSLIDKYSYLEEKKIFVGQPLYAFNYCTIDVYNELVNRIIIDLEINYYLPHLFSSKEEKINAKYLNLNADHLTLEVLSSKYKLILYSFGSSIVLSSKVINPDSKTNIIKYSSFTFKVSDILERNSDNIILYNDEL